jgi:putative protease
MGESTPQRSLSSPDENVSRSDLTHVFARGQDENHDGLTPGFFEGPQHQRLVRGRSPRHRGVHLGRVVSSNCHSGTLIVKFDERLLDEEEFPLKRGDGIVVDRGMPQEEELGGPIYDVKWNNSDKTVEIRFGRDVERRWEDNDDAVANGRTPQSYYKRGESHGSTAPVVMAPKGSHVWKTSDSDVGKRMRRLAELDPPRSPAKVFVVGKIGEPLTVTIVDERSGIVGEASTLDLGVLEASEGSGLNEKSIRKAIGTLGNSRWSISGDGIDLSKLEEGCWCPVSWIKETRRTALENLEDAFAEKATTAVRQTEAISIDDTNSIVDQLLGDMSTDHATTVSSTPSQCTKTRISVLARNYEQVNAICKMIERFDGVGSEIDASFLDEICIDFLEVEGIRAAVSRVREVKSQSAHGVRVVVASPRVIKPGEEGIWRTLLKTEPDAILIRSTGLLHRLTSLGGSGKRVQIQSTKAGESLEVAIPELIGDFSLNAANAITAYELLQSGLNRITAAYDLSANAITELATLLGSKASQLEVVVHQHMPIFHTEHCEYLVCVNESMQASRRLPYALTLRCFPIGNRCLRSFSFTWRFISRLWSRVYEEHSSFARPKRQRQLSPC